LASCNTLVETNQGYFGTFNFAALDEAAAFVDATERNKVIDPLLTAVTNLNAGQNLTSQPDAAEMSATLGSTVLVDLVSDTNVVLASYDSLIKEMIDNCTGTCGSPLRTKQIVKAVCAAAAGSAAMLVQ
jgi:hypothetical protein